MNRLSYSTFSKLHNNLNINIFPFLLLISCFLGYFCADVKLGTLVFLGLNFLVCNIVAYLKARKLFLQIFLSSVAFFAFFTFFEARLNNNLIKSREKISATGFVLSSTKKGRYYVSKIKTSKINYKPSKCVINIFTKTPMQKGWKISFKGKNSINQRLFDIGSNFKRSMKLRGECGTVFVSKFKILNDDVGVIEKTRQYIKSNILKYSKDINSQGLILALIVGETGYIESGYIDAIRNSGCAHILAISGLHVAILAIFLNFIFTRLVFFINSSWLNHINTHRVIQFFVLICVLFYVSLAGFSISAKRSFYMVSVAYLCFVFNRNANSKSFLYFALIIFCIFAPQDVMSISFQLSFLATFTVISIYSKHDIFKDANYISRVFRYITSAFTSSLIVSFMISPVEMYYFNRVPILSPLGNLLIVPVVEFFILPASFIASIFSVKPLFYLIDMATNFIYSVGFVISDLKFSYFNIPQVNSWFAFVLLSLFFGIFFIKNKIIRLSLSVLTTIFIAVYFYSYDKPDCIATGDLKNILCKSLMKKNTYCLVKKSKEYVIKNWQTKLNSKVKECYDYDYNKYDLLNENRLDVDLIVIRNGQLSIFD